MLPEKWAIKITQENQKVVGKYFSVVSNCYKQGWINQYLHSLNHQNQKPTKRANSNFANIYIRNGFEEITFEDFKQYVLNKTEEKIVEDYSYLIPILKELNVT